MQYRKPLFRTGPAFLAAGAVLAVGLVAALPNRAAAQASFTFGINNDGYLGLRNTSNPATNLTSLTVTFTPPNQTFFDTFFTNPGNFSLPFFVFDNDGVGTVNLPGNFVTDGKQTATFTFTGFNVSNAIGIGFDLDAFNDIDGEGSPAGGLVTAQFSNGQTASGIIGSNNVNVAGIGTFQNGVSATAVPEPGEYATAAAFIGSMGILVVRGRRRRTQKA